MLPFSNPSEDIDEQVPPQPPQEQNPAAVGVDTVGEVGGMGSVGRVGSAGTMAPQMFRKALQHLLLILSMPTSHEDQQEIMQILKSNPPLMAAFIKHKQKCNNLVLPLPRAPWRTAQEWAAWATCQQLGGVNGRPSVVHRRSSHTQNMCSCWESSGENLPISQPVRMGSVGRRGQGGRPGVRGRRGRGRRGVQGRR